LLIGEQATYRGERRVRSVECFSTTVDLRERLKSHSRESIHAVFHAAAVSDFTFGKVWCRSAAGEMTEIKSGKISTRQGTLLAELLPTPKIIAELRNWYPEAQLVGWKYEVEGNREQVIQLGERQLRDCRTDGCVVNGKAYGAGFGLVTGAGKSRHLEDNAALFAALEELASK
jgi:phosphopantothenoylcysteine synthetase/decarboxylase